MLSMTILQARHTWNSLDWRRSHVQIMLCEQTKLRSKPHILTVAARPNIELGQPQKLSKLLLLSSNLYIYGANQATRSQRRSSTRSSTRYALPKRSKQAKIPMRQIQKQSHRFLKSPFSSIQTIRRYKRSPMHHDSPLWRTLRTKTVLLVPSHHQRNHQRLAQPHHINKAAIRSISYHLQQIITLANILSRRRQRSHPQQQMVIAGKVLSEAATFLLPSMTIQRLRLTQTFPHLSPQPLS